MAHLLDSLSSTTLDCGSNEFKEWSKYMEQLNQVWVLINKENEPAEWPTVSLWSLFDFSSEVFIWQPPSDLSGFLPMPPSSTTPVNTLKGWENSLGSESGKAQRDKLRADLKIRLDGGKGVGPARQPKSAEERKKGGKPRDTLVDDLVFEFTERVAGTTKEKLVVYCVACDKKAFGRDASRIKNHAKGCNVYKIQCSHLKKSNNNKIYRNLL